MITNLQFETELFKNSKDYERKELFHLAYTQFPYLSSFEAETLVNMLKDDEILEAVEFMRQVMLYIEF